ncbi:sulfotransferase family protein [Candidatus Planktophila limnetica]|uniref:sulfotransferase family protein n=1 Tax=Candidatus Planktophila limnetica TaxID=573600 RepID=UPI000BAC7CBC|nr:sulfotransferase [Candidatus Planktophila limnetica]
MKPVFVGGTGRSGTTVVGDLLGLHQDIRTSVPIEIKFLANKSGLLQLVFGRDTPDIEKKIALLDLRSRLRRYKRKREKFKKIQVEFLDRIWNTWWDIDAPPPHGRGLQSGITKKQLEKLLATLIFELRINRVWAARRFMRNFISSQAAHRGQKYWVETTPLNIAQAERILKIFPNALFINMVRDPRDVIASLLTKNWGPTTPLEGIEWIQKRLIDAHHALRTIPAKQQITIALEDLAINNREQSYQALLTFLGLQDDPAMRAFFETELTPQAATSGRWKSEIASPEFLSAYAELEKRLAALD